MYGLRADFISRNHPCGKLHTNISYKKLLYQSEHIINARIDFFRKRSIYYSGWSMEDWWDEKLRSEEKELREKQKLLGDEDKRVTIGNTQQERLLEAAKREISNKEFIPKWPKRIYKKLVKCPKQMPLPQEESCASKNTIGYLNLTQVKLKCKDSDIIVPVTEKTKKPLTRPIPYLPIILHWKKMDNTLGYPQLKVSASMFKCGYYTEHM